MRSPRGRSLLARPVSNRPGSADRKRQSLTPCLPRRFGCQPPAVTTGHQPPRSPLPTVLRCCYEAKSVYDPGCRRPKTKYETGTTPAELTTVTTVAHSHFGPRTWLAGRRLRSTSAAILRMPSATAALTSNLRVRSPRSLHCFLAAMTSLHTARIPIPCTLPAIAGICPVMLPHGRPPDPLHAIDEPAADASTRTRPLPFVSAGQQADGLEATRCGLWRYEVWLLADCWPFRDASAQESLREGHPVVGAPGTVSVAASAGLLRGARRPSPLPRPRRRRVGPAVPVPAGGRLGPPRPACGPAGRPAVGGPARRSGQPTS
jgi:hypothetical protein